MIMLLTPVTLVTVQEDLNKMIGTILQYVLDHNPQRKEYLPNRLRRLRLLRMNG